MSSLNKAMIIGHLGAAPEIRNTQNNTAVANFSVATESRYKDSNGEYQSDTDWHNIVAWGRTAEVCQEYLRKGSKVYIEGPISTDSYEDKDGVKRYKTQITALRMVMLDSKSDNQQGGGRPQAQPQQKPQFNAEDFDDMDDDLPF